jgi:photosystem II stability/assembly factor-like uncharacterized protein
MIYLGTDNGIAICEKVTDWRILLRGLEGQRVTSMATSDEVILAGTTNGIFCSEDEGKNWVETSTGLNQRHVRWMAYHPNITKLLFAGTEPASIFISRNDGKSWNECLEVSDLRDEHGWFLPYSPEAGCVRGFAFHGERGYAAVEVGGVLRSDDNGSSWRLAEGSDGNPNLGGAPEPLIYPDVHSLQVHPSSPDLVDAPTGGGFYRSFDGGATWKHLYDCYCRAVWTDAADSNHLILGPADGVARNGRIEETYDGGHTWSMASGGLDVPWSRHMVERFTQVGSELLSVLSNGELMCTALSSLSWRRILPDSGRVNAVAIGP